MQMRVFGAHPDTSNARMMITHDDKSNDCAPLVSLDDHVSHEQQPTT
jgi:hypothetical protein